MTKNKIEEFEKEKAASIQRMANDPDVCSSTKTWFDTTYKHNYSYNFTWMGRPIIQYPQDIIAMQEIIWKTKPDIIIETGVAHGGSLILYASLLHLLGGNGEVIGIDIDIRPHNRKEIESHPMYDRITLLEGSSIDTEILKKVTELASHGNKILVVLDSNHTHEHVFKELELYSPLVSLGNYLIVFDTVIEDLPDNAFPDRPWNKGNNPKTAVHEFLKKNDRFEIDHEIQNKLQITVAPDGFLKCIKQ